MRFFPAILSLVLVLASPALSEDVEKATSEGKPNDSPSPQNEPDVVQIAQVGGNQVTLPPAILKVTTPPPAVLVTTAAPGDNASTTPPPAAGPGLIERLRNEFSEIRKVYQEKGLWAATRHILRLDAATKRAMLRANPSLFNVEDLKIIKIVQGTLLPQKS